MTSQEKLQMAIGGLILQQLQAADAIEQLTKQLQDAQGTILKLSTPTNQPLKASTENTDKVAENG